MKCEVCGNTIGDQERLIWKCNSCGKLMGITAEKLKTLSARKKTQASVSILACPECHAPLDDGNENIEYTCHCGAKTPMKLLNVSGLEDNGKGESIIEEIPSITEPEVPIMASPKLPVVPNPTGYSCANCGTLLEEDQEFCPKCGTARKKEVPQNICQNCGTLLKEGQEFCPKCGQKANANLSGGMASAIDQFNSQIKKKNDKKKKTPIIAGVAVLIVILLAVALKVVVVPRVFVSVDTLCERGEYEKAYKKAKDDEKMEVLGENIVAYLSNETSDSLKDPTSFLLRDAWFVGTYVEDDDLVKMQAVLYVSGKNSYGGTVSNYWFYVYNKNDEDFELWGTTSTLNPDKDDDDYYVGVLCKMIIEDDNVTQLDKSSVKNINTFFDEATLDQVDMLEVDELDTSTMPKDDDDSDD